MLNDVMCIVWKEWREQLGGRGLRGQAGALLNLAVFGVLMPLQLGRSWVESPMLLLVWAWVPMFMVTTVIADAMAGERERHTLETLLATRLPDRAILFGKMAAAIAYAGAITVGCVVLSGITFAVTNRLPPLTAGTMLVIGVVLVVGLAIALFVASIGTFMSLCAPTVRQATQWVSGSVILLLLGPVVLLRQGLPSPMRELLFRYPVLLPLLPVAGFAALVLLDVAAIRLLIGRFRRARLIAS